MNKAQIKQVFIYLGALFVIVTLLVIGFQSTSTLFSESCSAQQQAFQTTLFDLLNRNRGPGNAEQVAINAPCDYTTMCIGEQQAPSAPPTVNSTLQAGTGENIFLLQNNELQDMLSYDELDGQPVQCVQANSGQFTFTIEGRPQGHVTIS